MISPPTEPSSGTQTCAGRVYRMASSRLSATARPTHCLAAVPGAFKRNLVAVKSALAAGVASHDRGLETPEEILGLAQEHFLSVARFGRLPQDRFWATLYSMKASSRA